MEGSRIILKIIDIMRDPSIDKDGWIENRIFTYVRLAAGSFGCGEVDEGYAALDRCVELCSVYAEIPYETELAFNSPALDEISESCGDPSFIYESVIVPLTTNSGWEWFNGVRGEERFKEIISKITEIFEEMKSREGKE